MSSLRPNLICIGAQKAGTTWLYNILQNHPDVWMPPVKEIHYFDEVHLSYTNWRRKRIQQLQAALTQYQKGNLDRQKLVLLSRMAIAETIDDDYYLSLFQEADRKIVADITPDYSALDDAGFAHMARLLPEAKIIFIMRNPVKRAWSQAVMRKRKQLAIKEKINHKQWLEVIENNRNYRLSNYIETVRLCEKSFAPENLLFLIYDDICLQPFETIEKICQFLAIDYQPEFFAQKVERRFNANPKCNMPLNIETFLEEKFCGQFDFVRKAFNPVSFKM